VSQQTSAKPTHPAKGSYYGQHNTRGVKTG